MQFNAGDVIRMTADMDKRTVSYAVNGVHCGTAFSDIDEEVAFAVSLYAAGEAVTVISAKQAAACKCIPLCCLLCVHVHTDTDSLSPLYR